MNCTLLLVEIENCKKFLCQVNKGLTNLVREIF